MVSAEEVSQVVVMMAPGPVREECLLGSVPALPTSLVAVDGTGLTRSAVAVFGRGPHHVAPLAVLHLHAELLAHLGGEVHPGLPAGPAGPDDVQSSELEEEEVLLLPGATESHVVTERDVLVDPAALVASLVAGQDQAVPGVGPHPHAVLHTGRPALPPPPAPPARPLDWSALTSPAPVSARPPTAGAL